MARVKVGLYRRGMREMLQSEPVALALQPFAAAIEAAVSAHQSVRRHNLPVTTDAYTTDRAARAVNILHPAGLAVEAKYGVLADAARAAGLEVTTTKRRSE